ncbi:putative ribosomal protein L21 [Helianthus annuus]|nr:putative ribosomal protein L21 [Helianthus annuus]
MSEVIKEKHKFKFVNVISLGVNRKKLGIGAHQFKVSNGDCIYTEKLKFCEVNDKVLMLGSKTQTMIGRPVLPEAAVHAVVEEHALDAKVIIFKKKRRKNYRRTKGHRQVKIDVCYFNLFTYKLVDLG